MTQPTPQPAPQPIIRLDRELMEADAQIDLAEEIRLVDEVIEEPVVGADGELLVADPHVDMAEYQEYVAERAAPQLAREAAARNQSLVVVLVVLVVAGLIAAGLISSSTRLTENPIEPRPVLALITDNRLRLPDAGYALQVVMDSAAAPTSLAWSPDGERLATLGRNKELTLWTVVGEQRLLITNVDAFVWWQNGTVLTLMMGGQLVSFSFRTGVSDPRERPLDDWLEPYQVVDSPTGGHLLIENRLRERLYVNDRWDFFQAETPITSAVWERNGQSILIMMEGNVYRWDWRDETTRLVAEARPDIPLDVIHPMPDYSNWEYIAWGKAGSSLQFLRLADNFRTILARGLVANASDAWLSPTGEWVAVKGPQALALYDTENFSRGVARELPDGTNIQAVAWSRDERYLAIGASDGLILWSPGVVPK